MATNDKNDIVNHSFLKQDTKQIREIEKYAMFSGGIYHHRASAKTGQGVETCFNQLVQKIWSNICMQQFEKAGKPISNYSGSMDSNDAMFQFKPLQAQQKTRRNNNKILSSMDAAVMLDGTKLIADSIFDDDNSKDINRRSNAFQKNSITQDNGFFGCGEQSFKLNKIDHQKFYKRYN